MLKNVLIGLVVVGFATPALAKPLPATMKVTLKKGKPYLATEGVTVQLVDNWNPWSDVKATLSDDGAELLLQRDTCGMGLEFDESPLGIPLTAVTAKVENAKGMALHIKKKYADAAKLFEQATGHDPATPVYATNWLSALTMGGEIERANKLLEDGLAKSNIAWFAWRLAVDKELTKLKDQPGAKKLRADKPGKLTGKKLGDSIAISPLGLAAFTTANLAGMSSDPYISFVQLDTGKETMRVPAASKDADATLAVLGFATVKGKMHSADDEADKLSAKLQGGADVKGIALVNGYYVYLEREGGCDVSEVRLHGGAEKAK